MNELDNLKILFNDHKCALLSEEPINLDKLKYVCSCNREDYISIFKFKMIGNCDLCNGINKTNRKYTIQFVRQYFERYGCELISTYKNWEHKLQYKCKCTHITNTSLRSFMTRNPSKKCRSCIQREYNNDELKKLFSANGCELQSKWTGVNKPVIFKCSCGKLGNKTIYRFKEHPYCGACGTEKNINSKKYTFDEVYDYFEQQNCKLISNSYTNSHEKLDYICVCGEYSSIRFYCFLQGQRCGCIKSLGEQFIQNTIKELGYSYKAQYKFNNCINERRLSFDFYIDNKFLIEVDGEQHFKSIEKWGGIPALKKRIKRDMIKNKYCIDNNIPLLRISFKEIKKIHIILKLYISLIENNLVSSIMFTNDILYRDMFNNIRDKLEILSFSNNISINNDIHQKLKNDIDECEYKKLLLLI